jgi:hypothetical protein
MDFNIEDFLPKYPNIINNGSLPEYMSPYDNNFTQAIYNKEEFNELKLSKREEKEEGEGNEGEENKSDQKPGGNTSPSQDSKGRGTAPKGGTGKQ